MARPMMFIHGLHSSGSGFKGQFFRTVFPGILTPDFTGPFPERMKRLEALALPPAAWTLIGSSLGGLMAAVLAGKSPDIVASLVLLAPAFRQAEIDSGLLREITCPVTIYHGRNDTIVPMMEARETARRICRRLTFHETDDDHLLHRTVKSIDWSRFR